MRRDRGESEACTHRKLRGHRWECSEPASGLCLRLVVLVAAEQAVLDVSVLHARANVRSYGIGSGRRRGGLLRREGGGGGNSYWRSLGAAAAAAAAQERERERERN